MLSSIYIKNLFGLYSYKLDLKPTKNSPIRFITGPNGYGKTTLLNILESVFTCRFSDLLKTRFDSLELSFDDDCFLEIKQSIDYEIIKNNIFSDESTSTVSGLCIGFYRGESEVYYTSMNASGIDRNPNSMNNPMLAYLKSQPIYYIRDTRLHKEKAKLSVVENAKKMGQFLSECRQRIDGHKTSEKKRTYGSINEDEYNKVKENLKDDIETLLWGKILDKDPLPPYDKDRCDDLKALSEKVSEYIKEERVLTEKLKSFKNIIKNCDFSDKLMKLDPTHGYRFALNNEDETLLQANSLSSGEQHALIMFFELLFIVDDASLVLIDEPELSFHMAWQMNFLDNLREIIKLRDLQCIVCTHSPQIFDCDFDLTEDLFTKMEETKLK